MLPLHDIVHYMYHMIVYIMVYICLYIPRFVVELCEPVQVRSLDIANFELFSSLPEKFDVQISDR